MPSLTSLTLTALAVCCSAVAAVPNTARNLNVHYAYENGRAFNYTDEELWSYWDMVQPPITTMSPFFLNQANLAQYQNMTDMVKARNITLVPAVGGPVTGGNAQDGDLNSTKFLNIATGYRAISDSIRLEELQGYYDKYNDTGIRAMIEHCIHKGFKYIYLSPWPVSKHGEVVPLNYSQISGTHHSVYVKGPGTKIEPDPKNWTPGSQVQIQAVIKYEKKLNNPSFVSFVGYQNIQQEILTGLNNNPSASIADLNITLNAIKNQYASDDLHWMAPFTPSYDPVQVGSWSWIAKQLSSM